MTMQSDSIRPLSDGECETISGGIGWFAVFAVLGGAAATGSILAICTTVKEEEPLIPNIQFPD